MHRIDREEVNGAAENARQPVRKQPLRVAGPIDVPQTGPTECGGDDEAVERADVIGGNDARHGQRQLGNAGDAQPGQAAHDDAIDRIDRNAEYRQQRAGRRQPMFYVERQCGLAGRRRGGSGPAIDRQPQQIADRPDSGEIILGESDARALVQATGRAPSPERIEVQIESEIDVEIERALGKMLAQQAPDGRRGWVAQQRFVFQGRRVGRAPRAAGERPGVEGR
jgi:hypothetical protein